jgi:hypothetical protein
MTEELEEVVQIVRWVLKAISKHACERAKTKVWLVTYWTEPAYEDQLGPLEVRGCYNRRSVWYQLCNLWDDMLKQEWSSDRNESCTHLVSSTWNRLEDAACQLLVILF